MCIGEREGPGGGRRGASIGKQVGCEGRPWMGTVKEEVIAMIREMPGDPSIEDIMEELYVRHKIDVGLRQLDEGKGIPHEQIKEHFKKCFE
jgi:hypothetical protein